MNVALNNINNNFDNNNNNNNNKNKKKKFWKKKKISGKGAARTGKGFTLFIYTRMNILTMLIEPQSN